MSKTAAQPAWASALLDTSLTPMERILLAILARHQGRNDYAWPSHSQLAGELGTNRGTVKYLIRGLERKGRLTVERPDRQGRTQTNRYVVRGAKGVVGEPPCVRAKGVVGAPERGSSGARLATGIRKNKSRKSQCGGAHYPFLPPTTKEVEAYATSLGFDVLDADRFVDYYTANGWHVGTAPMRDWRAAVRNWQRHDAGRGKAVEADDGDGDPTEEQWPDDPDDVSLDAYEAGRQAMGRSS